MSAIDMTVFRRHGEPHDLHFFQGIIGSCGCEFIRPIQQSVVVLPETRDAAMARAGRGLLLIDGDDELRDGYPETTCHATILAVGPKVKGLFGGDKVIVPTLRDAHKYAFQTPLGRVLVLLEDDVYAVIESEVEKS